jgi:bacillithiol biosynthesis cysteine-adding enzyme BshC
MNPEILTQPLAIPPVAAGAMSGGVDPRYEPRPHGKDEWIARARSVMGGVSTDWLARLDGALLPKGEAEAQLARVADGKGIVITTGQQPGLFGGPVYTLSKALSAFALAGALEKLTGIPVAPVFWAATDDSDFREASRIAVSVPGGARELVMEPAAPIGVPMSKMPLGDLAPLIAELVAASGSGVYPDAVARLDEFYKPGATVGGAYVALLRELFEPLGIAVLDASHPAVRQASAPIIKLALERSDEISKAIAANNAGIEKDGHQLQVQDVAGLSLVFENTSSGRKRIPRKRGARDIGPDADLGPNVLLRPIVERQILPTAAYVGGPAEIAYFSQLGPIADTLGVPRPLIVPRWSCTILEPHVKKIVAKLGVAIEELQDPHAAETKLAREKLPDNVHAEIAAFRQSIEERSASLSRVVNSPRPVVGKAVVEGLRHNLLHRVERFERRLIAASKRANADLMHDVATARGSLFPLGRPQERALSFVPFIARYGRKLQDKMLEKASEHARTLL